jgi:hypothetical protein
MNSSLRGAIKALAMRPMVLEFIIQLGAGLRVQVVNIERFDEVMEMGKEGGAEMVERCVQFCVGVSSERLVSNQLSR